MPLGWEWRGGRRGGKRGGVCREGGGRGMWQTIGRWGEGGGGWGGWGCEVGRFATVGVCPTPAF